MFRKVLIANRAEIAVRITKTLRRLGIVSVAVFSDADSGAFHVRAADEAYYIGPSEARLSYLNADAILEAARQSGAEAIHPGYGFLSENAEFARAVQAAGLTWIGPSPESITALGDKASAKRLAAAAGVPVVPGYDGAEQDGDRLLSEAERIGFPLLIKALAGGGGRGMREVHEAAEFDEALASARREALSGFGDERVLLERMITGARHVEVQVFGDTHGNTIHLGERDCSVQRRHQKVIEEAPSPAVDEPLRARLGEAAVAVARAAGYTNAGTVEFLLEANRDFYFLEVNTRLQVEHPVTELVTGLDLVEWQLRVAAGEPLPLRQKDVELTGHAVEVRIYAEDPYNGFLPSTGTVRGFRGWTTAYSPGAEDGPGNRLVLRLDAGYESGDRVSSFYDAMLAKLVVWLPDRALALSVAHNSLLRFEIQGVATNLPLLRAVIDSMRGGVEFDTESLEQFWENGEPWPAVPHQDLIKPVLDLQFPPLGRDPASPWSTTSGWRQARATRRVPLAAEGQLIVAAVEPEAAELSSAESSRWLVTLPGGGDPVPAEAMVREMGIEIRTLGRPINVSFPGFQARHGISLRAPTYDLHIPAPKTPDELSSGGGFAAAGQLVAPMPGTVVRVNVNEGDRVQPRQTLAVLDAMKMEHAMQAGSAGVVRRLLCSAGQRVAAGELLIEIEPES